MTSVHPVIRYLILCSDVKSEELGENSVSLIGLLTTIRSREPDVQFVRFEKMCVFMTSTGGRGPARGYVEIRFADTNEVVMRTRERVIDFSTDPLEVQIFTFRLHNLLFPEFGLYVFAFCYNDEEIASQFLVLRR